MNEEEQSVVGNLEDLVEAWEVAQNESNQHRLLYLLHGAEEEEASVVTLETEEEEIGGAVDSTREASEEAEEDFGVEGLVTAVEGEVSVTEVGSVTVAEVEADTEIETAAAAVSEEVTVVSEETMDTVAEGASGKLCFYVSSIDTDFCPGAVVEEVLATVEVDSTAHRLRISVKATSMDRQAMAVLHLEVGMEITREAKDQEEVSMSVIPNVHVTNPRVETVFRMSFFFFIRFRCSRATQ